MIAQKDNQLPDKTFLKKWQIMMKYKPAYAERQVMNDKSKVD
jgi:hypothetical protein